MGIDVKMITGDHIAIARRIAEILGLGRSAVCVKEMRLRDQRLQRL